MTLTRPSRPSGPPAPPAPPEPSGPSRTAGASGDDPAVPVRTRTVRRLRMRAGYAWRNSAHPLITWFRVRWDGRAAASRPAVVSSLGGVSITYAGLPEGLAHTLEFTELRREGTGGGAAVRTSHPVRAGDLGRPDRLPAADLTIIGTSAGRARRLPSEAALVLPMKVHLVVDFGRDRADPHRRVSKRERWQFSRNQRTRHWVWRTETDPAGFGLFYDRMYRPTMRLRHGSRGRTEARDIAYECLFRTGRLFLLSEGSRPVAGALCHWDPASATLTLRLLGVLDGADEHYDSGAFKAVYHFLVRWAADNGVRRVDFQGTEPFLSKGTFQWKRRFGSKVVLPPNHFGGKRLWLQVRRDTPAVRDFLVANPVLAETPDGLLEAVYFSDANRPPRLDLSAKAPGVHRVRRIDLDEFLARLPDEGSRPDGLATGRLG